MANALENVLFQLKFTAKSLNRQAIKAGREEAMEKAKVEKAMKQGQHDMARIYAQNAIRKQQEKLNVMQLQSRIDAVASRVQTAVTMRTINTNMTKVNRALDVALKSMNPAKIGEAMTVFERQFEDVDTATQLYDEMTSSATATSAPQDEVDKLMAQAADKAGVELNEDLQSATPAKTAIDTSEQGENVLSERLAALRN